MIVSLNIDGKTYDAMDGELLAVTLLKLGLEPFRSHPVDESPRSAYCMMGVCFDCLVTVNGKKNQQACLTVIKEGMRVERNCR